MTPPPRPAEVLTVQSDRTFDGVYVPTILLDDRLLLTLDRERALRYVAAWADAVARAEFDAAVFAQITAMGVGEREAAAIIANDLRQDRPPLDDEATAPLRLEPIMSTRTKRGQVAAYLGDEKVLQVDAPTVHAHIGKVLPVVMTCDLDAGYRRYAIAALDQPEWRAEAMVADLAGRGRLPETAGSEHDRWINEQFNALTAVAKTERKAGAAASSRPPWRANQSRARKKRR